MYINKHITHLTQAVEALVNEQKKSTGCPPPAVLYAVVVKAVLPAGAVPARKISVCLACEIVVQCPDVTSEDKKHFITQLVKKINKKKNSTIRKKMLAAR